jgi:FMN phosphatase YigB (HAD superfamily)
MSKPFTAVTAVALDMIGVLVTEERLISHGMAEYFGDQLLLPIDEIKERYDGGYCVGRLTREQFWDGLLEGDWHAAERDFLATRTFATDANVVTTRLAERYDLAVISDMPKEWAQMILDTHGISPTLSCAVYSNEGHGSKRDGGLFTALINSLARPANAIVLVDDRPANLERASQLGMNGILYAADQNRTADDSPRVSSLSQLLELLTDNSS